MGRKNLLISPVGKNAFEICKGWMSEDRSYDIILIYYDADGYEGFLGIADSIILTEGFKYPVIHQVLTSNLNLLSKYEYFFFPDDDIRMTCQDINNLFSFSKRHNTSVCQPSLYPENFNWAITQNNPATKFRYVSVVEIMCPLFSKDTLKKCLPSFIESYSGWGLEAAWFRLLGPKKNAFIVYDLVIVRHEGIRGNGSKMYDNLAKKGISPDNEWYYLQKKYDWEIDIYDIKPVYKVEFIWNSFVEKIKRFFFKTN